MFFKNLRIGARLAAGFLLMTALLAAVAVTSVYRLRDMDQTLEAMTETQQQLVTAYRLGAALNGAGKKDERIKLREDLVKSMAKEDEQAKELLQKVIDLDARYGPDEDSMVKLVEAERFDEAKAILLDRARGEHLAYAIALYKLADHGLAKVATLRKAAAERYETSCSIVITFALLSVLTALFLAFVITRGITSALRQAVRVAESIAQGDLTVRIESMTKDETGQVLSAMKAMTAKLSQTIGEVREGASALASASTQVSSSSQNLSQGTSEQAASVEETTASLEQMSASIAQNSEK